MEDKSCILITGATGLLGRELTRQLRNDPEHTYTLLTPTRRELDLTIRSHVIDWFDCEHPDYVFMLAAKVGGIADNLSDPVGFLSDNLRIADNLFRACNAYHVKKALFVGSSCMYPRHCNQPMGEEFLGTGVLEPTNEGYALAKLVGLRLAQDYHVQHGLLTVCPILCNLYGDDEESQANTHVIPMLIKRFLQAKAEHAPMLGLWGSGMARREFMHVTDAARGLLLCMKERKTPEPLNMGSGREVTIALLANRIAGIVGYAGTILWDITKPDGMARKLLDSTRARALGFRPEIALEDGLVRAVKTQRGEPP